VTQNMNTIQHLYPPHDVITKAFISVL